MSEILTIGMPDCRGTLSALSLQEDKFMLYQGKDLEEQAVLQTAARMCLAARTAPKTHGRDTIHTYVLTGEEKEALAKKMEEVGTREMGEEMWTWYGRDAKNVRASKAVVLIGTERKQRGTKRCNLCGLGGCAGNKKAGGTCSFALLDLGIAVCSAVTTASLDKADNRIMYSIGKVAEEMDFDPGCAWLGIPLSSSGKSIFFDRGITHS